MFDFRHKIGLYKKHFKIINFQVFNSIWIGPYMMYLSMVQWTYPAKDIIGETGCYLMNILRGMHLNEVQLQSFFISLFRFTCLYHGHFLQKISPNVSITMAETSISIENEYFGGDCSILLEFSQFLDTLWLFFHKTSCFACVCWGKAEEAIW